MIPAFSLSFLSPLLLLAGAAIAFTRPGRRPAGLPWWSEAMAFSALLLSLAGFVQFFLSGTASIGVLEGWAHLGLRADPVTLTLALLVSFIGWIVMRYSRTYLDGEAREGVFHGLMLMTLAAVLVFVQSASLVVLLAATIAVGLAMKRLLLFYPSRPEAQRASTKFSLVWHSGDVALVLAALMLVARFGTAREVTLDELRV